MKLSSVLLNSTLVHSQETPNKACTGPVGFVAIFEHFFGFELRLLPSILHTRPPAGNANR